MNIPKTAKERSRARRLRRRRDKGKCTGDELTWLANYETTRNPVIPIASAAGVQVTTHDAPAPPAAPAPVYGPQRPVAPAVAPSVHHGFVTSTAERDRQATPKGHVALAWGSTPEPTAALVAPPAPPVNVCDIPDCPKCKVIRGARTCGTTQERVWPPISDMSAKMLFGSVCFALSFAARYFRDDRRIIPPTDAHRAEGSAAYKEVCLRRANWIGAVDDLLSAGGCTARHVHLALTDPEQEPEPEVIDQGQKSKEAPKPKEGPKLVTEVPAGTPEKDRPKAPKVPKSKTSPTTAEA